MEIDPGVLDDLANTLADHRWVGYKPDISADQLEELVSVLWPGIVAADKDMKEKKSCG